MSTNTMTLTNSLFTAPFQDKGSYIETNRYVKLKHDGNFTIKYYTIKQYITPMYNTGGGTYGYNSATHFFQLST